ncbi:hypothetical protein DERF_013439 [Dermatophagoides farinae]|uniref:Uncharacterized protein n=1 Tax=Dermatophagoides farinae TaxID=6954 RepID=A0A922KV80_DERFA|nr:hypothetical protein DERF_013439 [Dermatophagoides farinae]
MKGEHPLANTWTQNDGDDDGEETESSSEVDWNEYFTGHEQAVIHEDFELGRSRLQFHMTQQAISSFHEAIGQCESKISKFYDEICQFNISSKKLCEQQRSHISDLYEENGLAVQRNGVEIKLGVCLAFVLGDNLGVCELLVMSRNFSKGFMCRYCGLTIFISMLVTHPSNMQQLSL